MIICDCLLGGLELFVNCCAGNQKKRKFDVHDTNIDEISAVVHTAKGIKHVTFIYQKGGFSCWDRMINLIKACFSRINFSCSSTSYFYGERACAFEQGGEGEGVTGKRYTRHTLNVMQHYEKLRKDDAALDEWAVQSPRSKAASTSNVS